MTGDGGPGRHRSLGELVASLPEGRRTVLAVSPHLDDAAFSAGATLAALAAAGVDVHVHTPFAGVPEGRLSPIAATIHAAAGLPASGDAVEVRRAEDAAAMATLGASWDHGDALDVIYRRDEGGAWRCTELWSPFGIDPGADQPLVRAVGSNLDRLLTSRAPGLVLTCAALGHHVDHRITRLAVLEAAASSGVAVLLWEDLPYGLWVDAADEVPSAAPLAVLSAPPAWDGKIRAIAAYRSQVSSFWPEGSGTDWAQLLRSHGERRGDGAAAERFWPGDPEADAEGR